MAMSPYPLVNVVSMALRSERRVLIQVAASEEHAARLLAADIRIKRKAPAQLLEVVKDASRPRSL
eukprot:2422422-Alexandrium_andersonii.AAC.1